MSKSKKLKKAQERQKQMAPKTPDRSYANKILIGLIVIAAIAIIIVVCVEQLSRKVAAMVGDEKLYQDEMMYYVQQTEQQATMMDSIYQQIYGSSYWDYTNEDGTTGREKAQTSIEDEMVMDEILYLEGKDSVTLSDEDKTTADETAKEAFEAIQSSDARKYSITLDKYKQVCERKAVADQYKQVLIDGFDIDDEAIKEGVDKDQYRQYDVKYYSISVEKPETTEKDADTEEDAAEDTASEDTSAADDEKAEEEYQKNLADAKTKLQSIKDEIDAGKSFEEVSETASKAGITLHIDSITGVTKADPSFEDAICEEIYKMENGDVSEVLEAEDGCYLFEMVDNNSTEAFDKEVQSQISDEEQSRFKTEYTDVLFPKYDVQINSKLWDNYTLGKVFKSES